MENENRRDIVYRIRVLGSWTVVICHCQASESEDRCEEREKERERECEKRRECQRENRTRPLCRSPVARADVCVH